MSPEQIIEKWVALASAAATPRFTFSETRRVAWR